ncbi:MAG: hypothetical protein SFX19_07980 [Alphaproteobacteria bacterium]|nr:hypothetical protein [Alphaproteobacteria bacterium]
MSTIIVFLLTWGQLAVLLSAWYMRLPEVYQALTGYGSPPYFVLNSLGSNSVDFSNPIMAAMLTFHIVKYVFLCRSQFITDRYSLHYMSIVGEVIYLVICWQYL